MRHHRGRLLGQQAYANTNRLFLKSFQEYRDDFRPPVLRHMPQHLTESASNFQKAFDAEITKRYCGPAHMAVSNDYMITSMFMDTNVGHGSRGMA